MRDTVTQTFTSQYVVLLHAVVNVWKYKHIFKAFTTLVQTTNILPVLVHSPCSCPNHWLTSLQANKI